MLTVYDVATDTRRPATQQDIDQMEAFIVAIQLKSEPLENHGRPAHGYDFKLACYPNRMRDDGYFVAEKKPIEPYPGISTIDGKPCYPSTPKTQWTLRSQLPCDFARELVWRWNAIAPDAR